MKDDTKKSTFTDQKRTWNECYGQHAAAAKQWRIVACLTTLLAVVGIFGTVYLSTQSRVVPYIVELSDKGTMVNIHPAEKTYIPDQRIVRATIARVFKDLRMVSPDIDVQRDSINRVYAHLANTFAAYNYINDWYRKNSPFERAADETVSVEIRNVLPLTAETWRVEWEEKRLSRQGKELPSLKMVGTVSIAFLEANPETLLLNPLGIFIKDTSWGTEF